MQKRNMPQKITLDQINRLTPEEFSEAPKNPIVIVLDDVRSMNNVGSVFRTADAFRVEKLYLCGITPTPPHRDIRKTAIGAEETVVWEHCPEIVLLLTKLKAEGYTLVAIEQTDNGTFLHQYTPPNTKIAVIFGNEVEGVAQSAIDLSDTIVEIPQEGTKHSLNISVAAGIVLYDLWAKIQNRTKS